MLKLKDLKVGDRATVTGFFGGSPSYRRKLLSMGLTLGAEFSVSRLAPLGDPVEIRVRGYALSLRKHEAEAINVARVTPPIVS
ncbi:FeoA family protein [Aliiroseovarius sp. F47248L]|uniref:FeoA family protein n=1 Tax=Aliiroseovarius sp. F47248L TaxID=2926420 RepID=UPI001FF4E06E|nr:FeoA family protein [Aliiroseovarius sp. F47248L]MCK0140497.1 ferrous iron transport protein A [Aliiroseovarius sp. F47248L]